MILHARGEKVAFDLYCNDSLSLMEICPATRILYSRSTNSIPTSAVSSFPNDSSTSASLDVAFCSRL